MTNLRMVIFNVNLPQMQTEELNMINSVFVCA